MRKTLKQRLIFVCHLLVLVAASTHAEAVSIQSGEGYQIQSSGGLYELNWYSIDGGGGTHSSGGDYSLTGTIGQAESGIHCKSDQEIAPGFEPSSDSDDGESPVILSDGFEACFFDEVYE